jgi:hypothetical protein
LLEHIGLRNKYTSPDSNKVFFFNYVDDEEMNSKVPINYLNIPKSYSE